MINLDRLEQLFQATVLLPEAQRGAFLDAACADDPDLRLEVEALLEADADAERDAFLHAPVSPVRDVPGDLMETAHPGVAVGTSIGPYVVIRRLGRGGMGDVYLARRDQPFKRYVAIKIIRRGMDTADVLQRFQMERQILAALDHPNIARLLDGGITDDGLPYFAMEYVDGIPLTEFCESRRLGLTERLRLFRTVCDAVHYAHQNLVLHRDLKPSNILVTEDGQARLLDFGIAKLLNPHLSPVTMPLTRTELRLMTPEYASPEQIRGATLTTASDVYSLGVILYELLTGRKPHSATGRPAHEIARAVCEEEPVRPSLRVASSVVDGDEGDPSREVDPMTVGMVRSAPVDRHARRIRGDLDNITLMALRKEPSRRYASAEQLGKDVTNHLDGRPVAARPSTVGYRAAKFVRRNRVAVSAGLAVLLALMAGLAGSLWQASEARQERNRADGARIQAERALAEAQAVTHYVTGLFGAINPYSSPGEDLTAHELLERGVRQVNELDGQPLIQARLLDMFGDVYRAMGRYDEAAELLKEALALRREHLSSPHRDLAESIYMLADVLRRYGNYSEAEPLYREALDMRRTLFAGANTDVAFSLNGLALLLMGQGRYEEAEPLFREALEMRIALYGEEHNEVAYSMSSLGMLLRRLERYDEAEQLYRRALETYRRIFGDAHPYVHGTLNNLGVVLRERGDYETAEPYLREALAGNAAVHGEEHPSTAQFIYNLAEVLRRTGRHSEAQRLFRQSLDVRRRVVDPMHVDIGLTLFSYAKSLQETGHLDLSEQHYLDALAVFRHHRDDDHPDVLEVVEALADLYASRQWADSEETYRQWLDRYSTATR